MTKPLGDSFIDWEHGTFGYGYGTGEPHVMAALKGFFSAIGRDNSPNAYDYQRIEQAIGPMATWLLINTLCREDIIEYGTSPRYGWLTPEGEALKAFIDDRTADQLVELCQVDADHVICYRDACNCGLHGYEEGRVCENPFWRRHS